MKKYKFRFKKFIKLIAYLVVSFVLSSAILYMFPNTVRRTVGITVLSALILPILVWAFKKKFSTENSVNVKWIPLTMFLLGITIPAVVAVSNPDFNMEIKTKTDETEDVKESYDKDLMGTVEETDAIEIAVSDIDSSVFELFYSLSYIRDGQLFSKPDCMEDTKIQNIMELIVHDVETSGLDLKKYNQEELNSGKYSELTEKANKAEKEYRKVSSLQDKQKNVSDIREYLKMRLEAYECASTSELARLIGNTYVELSEQQVVNDNISSNCKAIKYYINCCHLSEPTEKRDMFYEIGVRFNRIAETSHQIYLQEGSQEYKGLYLDALYMSAAYYKLFQSSYIEDYKSSFYLARSYKFLGESMTDANKIMYFEKGLRILHTLKDYPELKKESKTAIYNTIYNILIEYRDVPSDFWNEYSSTAIENEIDKINTLRQLDAVKTVEDY